MSTHCNFWAGRLDLSAVVVQRLPLAHSLRAQAGEPGKPSCASRAMYTTTASRTAFLLSCGLLIIYKVNGNDCDADEIGVAMLSCQEERETLSDASRLNDTSQLCQALQHYSECIGPKIIDCKGEALMAFNVIKQQYASAPYYCHIIEPWNDGSTDFKNNVNSQLHDDEDNDNHIMTNGPMVDQSRVTVAMLPSKTDAIEKKQPLPVAMTTAGTTDTHEDISNRSSNAPPSQSLYSIFILITVGLVTKSLIIFKL